MAPPKSLSHVWFRRASISLNLVALGFVLYIIASKFIQLNTTWSADLSPKIDSYLKLGGRVHYEYTGERGRINERSEPPFWNVTRPPIRRITAIYLPNPKCDSPLDFRMNPTEFVDQFDQAAIVDDDLKGLRDLRDLKTLVVASATITDAGVQHIRELKKLTTLSLSGSSITDKSVELVAGLRALECLGLRGTTITDAGLRKLESLGHLRCLDLTESHVSPQGVERIRAALPKCHVYYSRLPKK